MAILKNTSFREANGTLTLPSGTTAQRPLRPPNGAMRYNTSLGLTEVYINNGWHDASNGARLIDVWPTSIDSNGMFVELWGGGGGGGRPGGWSFGADGGAGGYSWGWVTNVSSGATLILQVGGGGALGGTSATFPGGGFVVGGGDNRYGSAGGGYSGLFLGSVSQANAMLIAGGGGGGGSSRSNTGNIGGAGGGIEGRDGHSPYDGKLEWRGRGGTQTFAGEASGRDRYGLTCNNSSDTQGALQGGRCTAGSGYGGGGGGGYWGGSAGGYSEANTMAGGGGGSGFVSKQYIVGGGTLAGAWRTPANPPSGSLAYGGTPSNAGNNGFARITRNGVVTTYSFTGSNVSITF